MSAKLIKGLLIKPKATAVHRRYNGMQSGLFFYSCDNSGMTLSIFKILSFFQILTLKSCLPVNNTSYLLHRMPGWQRFPNTDQILLLKAGSRWLSFLKSFSFTPASSSLPSPVDYTLQSTILTCRPNSLLAGRKHNIPRRFARISVMPDVYQFYQLI